MFSLQEYQSRLSALADSFLFFPSISFLAGTCEERSGLVWGSDKELNDDSMSLAASDAEEVSGSVDDHSLLRFGWTGGLVAPLYGSPPGLQAKLLFSMDKSEPDPATLRGLRRATDLALHTTSHAIGKSMASLVVLERHLWLTLTEIKDADNVPVTLILCRLSSQ